MPRLQYDLDKIEEMTQYAEGTFRARLKSCVAAISDNSGNPMLVWTWTFLEGPNKGQTAKSWTSKMENALFGIKMHMTAFGYSGKVDINTDRLVGKEVRLVMASRKGKNKQGEDTNFTSVVGLLPAKKGRGEDYDEEIEEEDFDDEEEEEEVPVRKKAASSKNGSVKRRQVVEEDEDEEDDEEEDEEPVRRRAPAKAVAKKSATRRSRVEEDDDEDEDDEEEEPVRKKRAAAKPVASARRNGSATKAKRRQDDDDDEDDEEVPF